MALSTPEVNLRDDPRSAAEARRWAKSVCLALHREDLTETVELAISELVTNSFLHGAPGYTVSVTGTRDFPRFSVRDTSTNPPHVLDFRPEDDLATVGRGLSIVAMCSSAWGANIDDIGKVIWFEPASDLEQNARGEIAACDLVYADWVQAPNVSSLIDPFSVQLLNTPLDLTYNFYLREREVRRELGLLTQMHPNAYPEAHQVLSQLMSLDHGYFVVDEQDQPYIVPAHEAVPGRSRDLVCYLEESAITAFQRIGETFALVDEFIRTNQMLTLPATPSVLAYRSWLYGEVISQSNGEPATPWHDSMIDNPRVL